MSTEVTWADIRAEMGRRRVNVAEVAERVQRKYARFSTILNADEETQPTPAFAEQVMKAIREIAEERAA